MREAILLLATFAIMALSGVTHGAAQGSSGFGSSLHARTITAAGDREPIERSKVVAKVPSP